MTVLGELHCAVLRESLGLIISCIDISCHFSVGFHLFLQPTCNIDLATYNKCLTPLHIAAHEGHTAMVELLVGCGADVTATVDDGNTALLLVLAQKKMKPLDQDTPHLNHVRQYPPCSVVVLCYGAVLPTYQRV